MDELNEVTDASGDGCKFYNENPQLCGEYDDDDFQANDVCCSCKGMDIFIDFA